VAAPCFESSPMLLAVRLLETDGSEDCTSSRLHSHSADYFFNVMIERV
ncbi:MAG: hypothetical protein ACI9EZ_001133, partial [Halobacteriales archaeon]